jgi:hypothetical protein
MALHLPVLTSESREWLAIAKGLSNVYNSTTAFRKNIIVQDT